MDVTAVAEHSAINFFFSVSHLIAATRDGADTREKIDYLSSIDAVCLVLSIGKALTMSCNPYKDCSYLCLSPSSRTDVIDIICRCTALLLVLDGLPKSNVRARLLLPHFSEWFSY